MRPGVGRATVVVTGRCVVTGSVFATEEQVTGEDQAGLEMTSVCFPRREVCGALGPLSVKPLLRIHLGEQRGLQVEETQGPRHTGVLLPHGQGDLQGEN